MSDVSTVSQRRSDGDEEGRSGRSENSSGIDRESAEDRPAGDPAELQRELAMLRRLTTEQEDELAALRRRLRDSPRRLHAMEERMLEFKRKLSRTSTQNARLDDKLREARSLLVALRSELEELTCPPSSYATVLGKNEDGTVDVRSGGRKLRVSVHSDVGSVAIGEEVALSDSMSVVLARRPNRTGEVVTVREVFGGGKRVVVTGRADEERVVGVSPSVSAEAIGSGDSVLVDSAAALVIERLPRPEVEDLILDEVPEVSYGDVGGLDAQIEKIKDAVELPYLHSTLFSEYDLLAPKGVLLYGPPGCGKTLIAKAVASSLTAKVAGLSGKAEARSCFLNVKGPELLSKYVGETERQIRRVFRRARERSSGGWPVIVFFDEMESLFRTRGSGISSDVESTVVPQLLAEIDGVEGLSNVIVIGASNREDLIDPAILRPGRLDVKIKIDRPDADAAADIFSRYLTTLAPLMHRLWRRSVAVIPIRL